MSPLLFHTQLDNYAVNFSKLSKFDPNIVILDGYNWQKTHEIRRTHGDVKINIVTFGIKWMKIM